jgi:putative endonuclease
MFFIYILQCQDGSYYTGHTENLENRLYQHQNKIISNCWLPIKLIHSEAFKTQED